MSAVKSIKLHPVFDHLGSHQISIQAWLPVSLLRGNKNPLFSGSLHPIPDSPHGPDDLPIRRISQLLPQPFHIHAQCIIIYKIPCLIPDAFQNLAPGKGLAPVVEKDQKKLVFQGVLINLWHLHIHFNTV